MKQQYEFEEWINLYCYINFTFFKESCEHCNDTMPSKLIDLDAFNSISGIYACNSTGHRYHETLKMYWSIFSKAFNVFSPKWQTKYRNGINKWLPVLANYGKYEFILNGMIFCAGMWYDLAISLHIQPIERFKCVSG